MDDHVMFVVGHRLCFEVEYLCRKLAGQVNPTSIRLEGREPTSILPLLSAREYNAKNIQKPTTNNQKSSILGERRQKEI
jgi:hypothetical protein